MEGGLRRVILVLTMLALPALLPPSGAADETGLTEDFMHDPANIELGQQLFRQQCTRCHGRSAYPGKAPRLNTSKMSPEEIYLKTTYGFGRMPPWEEYFSEHERMAITAYMKSNIFSN
jgi:mono/diheme cytochrome c family protein